MVNPEREPIKDEDNTTQKIDQDKYNEIKQRILSTVKEKGNENLAQLIETSTAKELSDEDKIQAWKSAFPEYESELTAVKIKADNFLEKDEFIATPEKFFKRNENGTNKFKPDLLAQELEKHYEFRYIEDTETLYVYQDKYWQDRGERLIRNEVNKRLGEEYEPAYASKTVDAIKDRPYLSLQKKDFRPAKNKVPFKNGTYHLDKKELVEHQPQDNFTHIIPWELNRDAQCNRIHKFLDNILQSDRDKEIILETIGYTLLSDMPYGHALLLHGKGKNGKSVLLELWKQLLGEGNYKEEELQQLENGRFATRWLYRKLGLFSDDMPSTKLETGNTLKSLTGGGDTRAEIKGGDHFEFKNYATPVFACNQIPESNDDSEGFYRRWEIVNFPYKFVEDPVKDNEKKQQPKDRLLKELTEEEQMKGLLHEALTSLEMVRDFGGFSHKTKAEDTRSLWKSYSSPFEQFVENCLEQGLTPNDIENLQGDSSNRNIDEFNYDFIVYDDLVWLIKKYCEHYGQRPPTRTSITQYLKNKSPYFVQVGRTRRLGDNNDRTKVYKFIRYSEEFVEFLKSNGDVSNCPYFFSNLCAHAKKTQQDIEKSMDTRTKPDSSKILDEIRDFIKEQRKEMVQIDDIIENLDFKNSLVEEKIQDMQQSDDLFEPEPGKVCMY